ncbi:MAG: S1/P1 nuclease, partial [Gammaproteobacteria bacterium]|nr:S1/P1 nuclease [Gammaproteobacteria bacterium]
MIKNPLMFRKHIVFTVLVSLVLNGYSKTSYAWGRDGHTTVGILAVNQLQHDALHELEGIIRPLNKEAMAKECNWPDVIRENEDDAWSAPLHYVNIPRGIDAYDQARDCPLHTDHLNHPERPPRYCVTEAIKHYASRLGNRKAPDGERKEAFAWLCHLVGDLHQPLHAGFADDRGGNDIDVKYKGEKMNLHHFWDSGLINEYAGSWQYLVGQTGPFPTVKAGSNWSQEMVNDWTSESHQLADRAAYPPKKKIKDSFEEQSWEHIQDQIKLAA